MKIIHIIYNDWNSNQIAILNKFGFKLQEGFKRLDVEDGELFRKLEPHLREWKVSMSVGTIYDKKDIAASNSLVYIGVWENGYPQPEQVSEYLEVTYNLDKYCKLCGIGAVQKGPFRNKKEPNWSSKKLFELNWVFDEIFLEKDFYETIFKPIGIDFIPVYIHKTNAISKTTVQLKIPKVEVSLSLETQPYTVCASCGEKKFNPQVKGFFPPFEEKIGEEFQIFKCKEVFGSGGRAFNRIS